MPAVVVICQMDSRVARDRFVAQCNRVPQHLVLLDKDTLPRCQRPRLPACAGGERLVETGFDPVIVTGRGTLAEFQGEVDLTVGAARGLVGAVDVRDGGDS